ncbi:DUF1735 domain-containing protein [Danxiaibacter flavus]|uniref:DUF1735 domain-containing protein n=1 Tax=Danxiaibacter flavus TaxID=3049108 RepID=A0ABV3ZCP1_9BACT|nr:DUF1735 domain-containing protein [Chitinophagaceae bacterium DXS]
MKKIIIKVLPLLIGITGLASCLKEAPSFNPDDSNNVVEFGNTGAVQHYGDQIGFASDLGSIAVGDTATFNVNLSYSGAKVAGEDITVTLDLDETLLTGTDHIMPPAELFSFPKTAVIKKGAQVTQIKVTIKRTEAFDFTVNYALPLKITAVSNNTPISGNFGAALYAFALRNQFDGVYQMKGYALRGGDANLTGYFKPIEMDLKTMGATSVQFGDLQVWGNGSGVGVGNPLISVDVKPSVDKYDVTMSSSGGIYNAPGYASHYDVASKTFYISFTWGAGPSARLATDTLTFLRARD